MNDDRPFPKVDSSLLAGLARALEHAAAAKNGEEHVRLARERLQLLADEQTDCRYEFEEEIGRGGMGVVYRVQDNDLRRALAMKVARDRQGTRDREATGSDPVTLARFLEEARVTGQLDHPGIVPLHELGIDAQGCVYFTMRLVRGKHLGEVFEAARSQEDGWSRERVIEAFVKVCDAVAYAHAKGVIHRDLKPQNVMTGRFGEVYVMDWGVAKVLGGDRGSRNARDDSSSGTLTLVRVASDKSSGGVTIAGSVFGTPTYMAPEQARGAIDEVDARADLYSLGAMLYHFLAGHPPYSPPGTKVSSHTVLMWVIEGPPKPLAAIAAGAPRELVAICEKAMARDKHDRYADVRKFADDLRAWLQGRPVSALPLGRFSRTTRWCRRNPWIAGLLIAVTLGGAIGLWRLADVGSELVRQVAIDDAASKASMLETVNGLYSSIVTARVDKAHVPVTHDWKEKPGAIPLPATFLTELADEISADSSGTVVKHYSDLPFKFRGKPMLDQFAEEALASLRLNPDAPVIRFEEHAGRPLLRYAVARRMGQSCVNCHNSHPESPKTDWKVGDVRGVLEIDRPLDADVERSRAGVRGTLMEVGLLVLGLTGLCAIALVRIARARQRG